MLDVRYSNQFKKDLRAIKKRRLNLQKLKDIVFKLANEEKLPASNRDHQLSGKLSKFRECHIEPDWLLIYQINNGEMVLIAQRTGTHADLFKV